MNKKLIVIATAVSLSLILTLVNYGSGKSGKKLVWNKGVSKSTIETPLNIPISIDNLDLKGIPQKAYDQVIQVLKSRPQSLIEPVVYVGPNVNRFRVNQELVVLKHAINLWAPYFNPQKFQILYVTTGDEAWLEKKSLELGLESMLEPGETWSERMNKFSGSAYAGLGKNIPTFVQELDSDFSGGYVQIGVHEYTHLFQDSYGGKNHHKFIWYKEGSATFFGWTLGFYPFDPKSNIRGDWLRTLFRNMSIDALNDFQSRDLQRFKNRIRSLEGFGPKLETVYASYWIGSLATETLVALYGFEKFIEFTKNIQTNDSVNALMLRTYGFSEDYFYEKLAPYAWSNACLVLCE